MPVGLFHTTGVARHKGRSSDLSLDRSINVVATIRRINMYEVKSSSGEACSDVNLQGATVTTY